MLAADGVEGLEQLQFRLRRLSALRLVSYTLRSKGRKLITVEPMTLGFHFAVPRVKPTARFKLSRFTYCRSHAGSFVLESPLSLVRTVISDHLVTSLLTELTQPRAYPDLCGALEGVGDNAAEACISFLCNAGLIFEVDEDGKSAEDRDVALTQWEFHDLLFHSRSRPGRHDYVACGDFRFLGNVQPLPAVKARMSDETVPLERPSLDELMNDDQPFTHVLEQRRSIRRQGEDPIDVRQLGEFLYRTARVRKLFDIDPMHRLHYEASSRPYPTGGGTYELELYVVIDRCTGIDSGLYHYRPKSHELEKLPDCHKQAAALLRDAQIAAYLPALPQVLIVITSRFQRVSWKYSGIAYATTLKNTGVLYQTMYLVAEAMGLAPCALGGGDVSFLANAVGADYWTESSVGEFLLGSRSR